MVNREAWATVSAIILLMSGIALSFLSFFLSVEHVIDSSVLWYFGQTLIYAGSLFGIKSYVDYRMQKKN